MCLAQGHNTVTPVRLEPAAPQTPPLSHCTPEEMLFKDISYLELLQPFCSAEQNNMCNCGGGNYEEQFCDFFFIGPVGQEMSFKIFLILSSGSPPVKWSGSIYAILKEGIIGNIHVKLCEIWTSGSGDIF